MRRIASGPVGVVVAALSVLGGCQTAGSFFLNFVGLEKKPLAVAVVMDPKPTAAVTALNPFPRYLALQNALSKQLDRPVAVDPCFEFQAAHGLSNGWYAVAVLTPAEFARLPAKDVGQVLAVPVDRQGRPAQTAVLIVPASSKLQDAADLRGKVVAFGPEDDGRTHLAALQLLRAAGVEKTDLSLEVLPIPGGLRHMPDMRSITQAVINGSAAAGFIDAGAWEALPEHSAGDEPARDKLRVIGRTAALPDRLLVASPRLDDATADAVRKFLLSEAKEHPEVLVPLEIGGYEVPGDDVVSTCRKLAAGPATSQPG